MENICKTIKIENLGLILSICIIIYLIFFDQYRIKGMQMEHMTDINAEAMSTLASMYSEGKLIISDLEVTNNVDVKGAINMTGDINATNVKFGDTTLQNGTNGSLKVQTPHGWGEFGPQNTEWLHIKTDRSKIYSEKETHVDGTINTYGKNDGITDTSTLKKLTSYTRIGGYAKDGGSMNILLEEGTHTLGNDRNGLYTYETQNRWDYIYVFKGWKFTGYDKGDKTDRVLENKTSYVKHMDVGEGNSDNNRINKYKLEWVGY